MGEGHPERPDRLRAVQQALPGAAFAALRRIEAPAATPRHAAAASIRAAYVDALLAARSARAELLRLDADTAMNAGHLPAALRAAGGAVAGGRRGDGGRADNAFVAMRPPGHHAERATAMGFCFFNNAAIAARHAQAAHGAERVAIVDFDVHHGNGTQDIFWADPTVLYCSTHQMPLYPGTRRAGRTRRARHDRQRAAAAPATAARRSGGACETVILPRLARLRARSRDHLGRLRRASARPARRAASWSRPISPGSPRS